MLSKKHDCEIYAPICKRFCKNCNHCNSYCPDFVPKNYHCEKLDKAPYVCNGCSKRLGCRLDKAFYKATTAQRQYKTVLVESRTGINISPEDLTLLDYIDSGALAVIMCKYVGNNSETYGYITGASFANQLGLTTQMPAVIEIVTNKESTKGRTVTIGGQTVRIKRPSLCITDENATILQAYLLKCNLTKKTTFRSISCTYWSYCKKTN